MVIEAAARIGNCRSRPTDGLWSWPGGKYRGFNDHHQMKELADEGGIRVSRETVRQNLRAEGIVSPRKRRPPRHRARRERRVAEGMMLQVDGSPHNWLEGRGPYLTLIGASMTSRPGSPARFSPPALP